MKKLFITLSVLSLQHTAHAQGGWVGNSPFAIASNGTYMPELLPLSTSDGDEETAQNYFLNRKGELSFDTSLAYTFSDKSENADHLLFGLNSAYGISDNVSFSAPFVFNIGLLNNNEEGHELAVTLGVPGFSYTEYRGFSLFPTTGIKYTYGQPKWRFIAGLSASKGLRLGRGSKTPAFDDEFERGIYFSSNLKGIYQVANWLSFEAGLNSYYKTNNNYGNTIYAGPNFEINDSITVFAHGSISKDESSAKENNGVVGASFSF